MIFEPIDSTTCSVADNRSSGALVIPDKVLIDGVEYTVTEFAEGDMFEPGANGSFINNNNITSIEIPGTITTISDHEFYYCRGLTSVVIKEGVQNIQDLAFWGCNKLTAVSVPNSIVDVGSRVFAASNVQYNQINNGKYVGNTESPYLVLIGLNDTSATSFIMNDECVLIAGQAFMGCNNLTAVSVSENLSNINSNALVGCSALALTTYSNAKYFGTKSNPYMLLVEATNKSITSCVIHTSCISIMQDAFSVCTSLTSITIPDSVKNIGSNAFGTCTGMTSITIGSGVTSIGYSAFRSCAGLTSISVDSGNSIYDSRNNCNAIIETATNTLIYGCKNTTIPNTVTSIKDYAFEGYTGLTSITIPDSVTSIGYKAFYGCTGLTNATIGSGVTSIGGSVFYGCSKLATVNVKATSVPTGGRSMFLNCSSSLVIYVPSTSVNAYKAASYWSDYSSKIEGKSSF